MDELLILFECVSIMFGRFKLSYTIVYLLKLYSNIFINKYGPTPAIFLLYYVLCFIN